jgi:hypothetical protein
MSDPNASEAEKNVSARFSVFLAATVSADKTPGRSKSGR